MSEHLHNHYADGGHHADCFRCLLNASSSEMYDALRYIVLSLENGKKITTADIGSLYDVLHKAEGQ